MLAEGTIVGDSFRVERWLGRGGMAEVYVATQLDLERTVALKVLAPELARAEHVRERFRREGRMQASVDHPNIVPVYAAQTWNDTAFIAMKLIRGTDLKQMIVNRLLDTGSTMRILTEVAQALDAAHAENLIHRDVKPQNVLVEQGGRGYLADFGLTRASASELSRLTETGQLIGSIDYMPPEHIQGEEPKPAGDVYALACVLFECLSGTVPFVKPTHAAVLFAHIAEPPPSLSSRRPGLPPALDEVIAWGMAKEPFLRPHTACELMDHARDALGEEIRAAMSPPPPVGFPEDAGLSPKARGAPPTQG